MDIVRAFGVTPISVKRAERLFWRMKCCTQAQQQLNEGQKLAMWPIS